MSFSPGAGIADNGSERSAARRFDFSLALSGGGYRAMLFHAGSVTRLNEAGLLSKLEAVSSVSGGSIAAGVLAQAWPSLDFEDGIAKNFRERVLLRLVAFSQRFVDAPAIIGGTLNPFSTASRAVASAYRKHLFGDIKLSQLAPAPRFILCASNLTTGSLFRMTSRYLADYRIGIARFTNEANATQADLPLADAVACSSAFPPFLSPYRFDISKLDWAHENLDEQVGPVVKPKRAVLTDGGVYDNHGIEPVLKRSNVLFVSDGGAPWRQSDSGFWNWYSQLKRVSDTTDSKRDLTPACSEAFVAG